MTTPVRAILCGLAIGLAGAAGQLTFVSLGYPQAARAALTVLLAATVGALAGMTAGGEAIKAAGVAGLISGVIVTAVGLSVVLRNPATLGGQPFASVESALRFGSSLIGGTVISSWLVAVIAMLIAFPFSQTARKGTRG